VRSLQRRAVCRSVRGDWREFLACCSIGGTYNKKWPYFRLGVKRKSTVGAYPSLPGCSIISSHHRLPRRSMKQAYLEVTYRNGKPSAAYYYLPRPDSQKSVRTRQIEPGLIVDFGANGRAMGIEITAPALLTVRILNRVLRELGCAPVRRADLAPLRAA